MVRVLDQPAQVVLPQRIVDWSPVVGIDQRKVPQLIALVDVRHARRAELQKGLRQAVEYPEKRHALLQLQEIFEERVGFRTVEDGSNELQNRLLVLGVRRNPR